MSYPRGVCPSSRAVAPNGYYSRSEANRRLSALVFCTIWLVLASGGEIPRVFHSQWIAGPGICGPDLRGWCRDMESSRNFWRIRPVIAGGSYRSIYCICRCRDSPQTVNSAQCGCRSPLAILTVNVAVAIAASILAVTYVEKPYRISLNYVFTKNQKGECSKRILNQPEFTFPRLPLLSLLRRITLASK
jgi:hypothetical protein